MLVHRERGKERKKGRKREREREFEKSVDLAESILHGIYSGSNSEREKENPSTALPASFYLFLKYKHGNRWQTESFHPARLPRGSPPHSPVLPLYTPATHVTKLFRIYEREGERGRRERERKHSQQEHPTYRLYITSHTAAACFFTHQKKNLI
jgi:hypothetical protein